MRNLKVVILALLLGLAGLPSSASALDFGGLDAVGEAVSQTWMCPAGSFLTGFNGNVGAWIDNFTPMCARWNSVTRTLPAGSPGDKFGFTNGGNLVQATCRTGEAVKGWSYGNVRGNDGNVQDLVLTCANATTLATVSGESPGLVSGTPDYPTTTICRGANELVDGMDVWFFHNRSITGIRVHCADANALKSAAASDMRRGMVHYETERRAEEKRVADATTQQTIDQARRHPRIIGALTGDVAGSATIDGTWNTTQGTMVLMANGNKPSGTYGTDGGQIGGRLNGTVLTGYWGENTSSRRCSHSKLGGTTDYWGQMTFTFSNQNRHFTGTWGYCDDPQTQAWSGDRVK